MIIIAYLAALGVAFPASPQDVGQASVPGVQQPLGADPALTSNRFGLYRNLFNQHWRNNPAVRPPSGRLIAGLVDYGEYWIDYNVSRVRARGYSGYRKGGWMSATTQPRPDHLSYRVVSGELERNGFSSPTAVHWQIDTFVRRMDDLFPYYPTSDSLLRTHSITTGKGDAKELHLVNDLYSPTKVGSYRYEFRPPAWVPEGWPKEYKSGKSAVYMLKPTRTESKATVPDEDAVYISEFEPFLFDKAFPKRLLKSVKEGETLEFWVLARTRKLVRIRAYYRGKQQLQFREIDQPALRFDLAGFQTNDKGTWTRLASVWIDEKDGKFILGDDTEGTAHGILNFFALFRLEPERSSDINFVYPPFVRSEKFEK